MNFKPTKWKVICSLISLVVVTIFMVDYITANACVTTEQIYQVGEFGIRGGCDVVDALLPSLLIFGIPAFIIVYVLWSLAEKRK